jgi:hypothetical protein
MITLSLAALLFPIASHHYNPGNEHYREVNPGVLAELKVNDATYEAGTYLNSIGHTTITVQRRFSGWEGNSINAGARIGLCSGYRASPIVPCGGASIRLGQYVDLMLVPPVHNFTPMVTAITFRMPL